jgi:hypothetical protein
MAALLFDRPGIPDAPDGMGLPGDGANDMHISGPTARPIAATTLARNFDEASRTLSFTIGDIELDEGLRHDLYDAAVVGSAMMMLGDAIRAVAWFVADGAVGEAKAMLRVRCQAEAGASPTVRRAVREGSAAVVDLENDMARRGKPRLRLVLVD